MEHALRRRMLARSLTALSSLQHSLESGHLRLGLCSQNRQLLEDLRQDTAAAFTALSGLVLGSTHGARLFMPPYPDRCGSTQGHALSAHQCCRSHLPI